MHRRAVLAAIASAGTLGVAGCSSSAPTTVTQADYPEYTDVPQSVSEYLSDTSNFDGTGADARSADEVTVRVGAAGNGGFRAFDPPVVAISTGTTVVWTWTGNGSHNVVSEGSGPLQSQTKVQSGYTYEHTFESPGTYRYVCTPHRYAGMKGAVIVE